MNFAAFTDTHVGQKTRSPNWDFAEHLDLLADDIMDMGVCAGLVPRQLRRLVHSGLPALTSHEPARGRGDAPRY